MKRVLITIFLTCAASLHCYAAQPTFAAASMKCGNTRFYVRTKFENDIAVEQTIEAKFTGKIGRKEVDLRQTKVVIPFELGDVRALSSSVTEWQCKKTRVGQVLVLWYACRQDLREDLPDTLCSQTSEWERYISTSGDVLDYGYSFDDPRYADLRARLGYHDNPPDQATIEDPFLPTH